VLVFCATSYSVILQNRGRQATCIYIHQHQTLLATSYSVILQNRGRQATCIYIHQHQTLLVFWATTYSVILQNQGRLVMSPLRVCTYTNVKRCSNFEPNLSHVPSTCIYIVHAQTSNVARILCNYIFCYSTESRQTRYVTTTCKYIHQHQTLLVFCATTYSVILQTRGWRVCHLYVCIHTPTSNVACTVLHVLSFYRIEVDKVCHLCVYIHTLTSSVVCTLRNDILCHYTKSRQTSHVTSMCTCMHQHQTLPVFCATTYSVIPQNWCRQDMSPPRVYTYTNINVARVLCHYIFCHSTGSRQTSHVTSTCVYIH
jgi:hypothetical protein